MWQNKAVTSRQSRNRMREIVRKGPGKSFCETLHEIYFLIKFTS